MSRRVYLHIGAPKTGTTYLQDRLALNRKSLARHDVHYPLGLHGSHFQAALDLIDVPWGGARKGAYGEWEALMGRVRRLEGTVVVSHEILAAARPDQVTRAMADLRGADVHLVYSARDLGRQIPAEWQESIKHRKVHSFARYLDKVQQAPRNNSPLWFWRVQGLPDVLRRWSAGLPPENVHVVTVPAPGGPRDELWRRFCTVFGIDPAWAPEDSDALNVSLGTAETAVLRRLNRKLRGKLDADDYRALVRQLLVHQNLAQRRNKTRATLPPKLFPWAQEVSEEWIEWIEGAGVDVVGDVADLRPVPPADDEEWADPDRPRGKDVAAAAVDALAAMTRHAAQRPDPREQLGARLSRAARRLRAQ